MDRRLCLASLMSVSEEATDCPCEKVVPAYIILVGGGCTWAVCCRRPCLFLPCEEAHAIALHRRYGPWLARTAPLKGTTPDVELVRGEQGTGVAVSGNENLLQCQPTFSALCCLPHKRLGAIGETTAGGNTRTREAIRKLASTLSLLENGRCRNRRHAHARVESTHGSRDDACWEASPRRCGCWRLAEKCRREERRKKLLYGATYAFLTGTVNVGRVAHRAGAEETYRSLHSVDKRWKGSPR